MAREELGQALARLRPIRTALHPAGKDVVWNIDGVANPPGTVESYEMSFPRVLEYLHADTFSDFLKRRKEKGFSTHVLDLFGGGYFIRDLSTVDSLTAVRLGDVDDELDEKLSDKLWESSGVERRFLEEDNEFLQQLRKFPQRKVVEGNIFHRQTMRSLHQHMKAQQILSFDLIACRPGGAFYPFESYSVSEEKEVIPIKVMYLRLFRDAYNMLSSENGVLVSEIPDGVYTDKELRRFQDFSNHAGIISGWDQGMSSGVLGLFGEKTKASPQRFDATYKNILRDVD